MVATSISAAHVLERCAELEARGIAFYQGMLRGTQSKWMQALARMLIEAEERHRDRFRQYAKIARDRVGEAAAGPVSADLKRLLSETIFMTGELAERTAKHMNDRAALEAAIKHESDLALLFAQLRAYIPDDQRSFIDRVIKEEQRHEAKLISMRKKYFR